MSIFPRSRFGLPEKHNFKALWRGILRIFLAHVAGYQAPLIPSRSIRTMAIASSRLSTLPNPNTLTAIHAKRIHDRH